ncbi:hypothetical protein ACLOJK_041733 [Asimina triloba]
MERKTIQDVKILKDLWTELQHKCCWSFLICWTVPVLRQLLPRIFHLSYESVGPRKNRSLKDLKSTSTSCQQVLLLTVIGEILNRMQLFPGLSDVWGRELAEELMMKGKFQDGSYTAPIQEV